MTQEKDDKSFSIPEVLSVNAINIDKRPRPEDWILIQGGMPKVGPVDPDKGLFNVIHDYINTSDPAGTGAVIPTSAQLIENWAVKVIRMRTPDNRIIEVPTALLWKFHGKSCEARSQTKYVRVPIKK